MSNHSITKLSAPFNKEIFFNELICELSDLLEKLTGKEDSEGLISLVGQSIGHRINDLYRNSAGVDKLDFEQVRDTLVDLKRRIDGNFQIVSADPEKIVLRNDRCPFGKRVVGHESMCMMTSNVFGIIASDNLGYAKVSLHETIARHKPECTVVVYLQDTAESRDDDGRVYCQSDKSTDETED